MRTKLYLSTCILALALGLAVVGSSPADAYERYFPGCVTCHGEFDNATSPKGTIFPGNSKHTMHNSNGSMNAECTLCHTNIGDNPLMDASGGTASNPGRGCVGCHGREMDAGNDGLSGGRGAGLRQHHTVSGVTACAGCHSDADPANYTPVGEHFNPQYYGVAADSNVAEPCNLTAENGVNENWSAEDPPAFIGLDNDGDGLYDASDPDCATTGCTADADCDDGMFCNGAETCDTGTGECLPGTPVDCDDGVGCTVDSCNETTDSCDNAPDDAACDDGLFCNGTETCDLTLDCQAGTPVDCDDGVGCTADSCNEETNSCDNAPDDAACDDGLFCNGAETCDPTLDCQAGSPPCDPATETCNEDADTCEPIGCTSDADCDDGLFCNGTETCDTATGECVAVSACPPAIDGCVTRGAECDEENDVCIDFADDSLCDDGMFCNGAETCDIVTGDCLAGTPVDCSDGVGCTVDSCNETTDSCDNAPDDAACDDGLFCNGTEVCDPALDCQPGSPPCDPATETCNEDADTCEPIGVAFDLDIFKFSASKKVLSGKVDPPGQQVKIKLWVSNPGPADELGLATVVGVQDGSVVYTESMMVSDFVDDEPTMYMFPSYDPAGIGEISWMVTIVDGDPDEDTATATTLVVGPGNRQGTVQRPMVSVQ
jgi:hypothetical protein